jgi:hypothetical protein
MGRSTAPPQAEDLPVVDDFICNGCGGRSEPTREHFFHHDVGRIILADPNLPGGDVRPRLEGGRYSEFVYGTGADGPLRRVNFNDAIKNLLSGESNRRRFPRRGDSTSTFTPNLVAEAARPPDGASCRGTRRKRLLGNRCMRPRWSARP